MRWLVVVLVVLFIGFCVKSLGSPVSDAVSNLVFIANSDKHLGSGIIVKDGYVMTCAHLVPHNKKVQVYYRPTEFNKKLPMAEVVYVNYDKDVALLKVPWVKGQAKFATPYLDEAVIEVGYTSGQQFVFHGRICRIEPDIAEVDMRASFGSSGSGVYDEQTGDLVGMVMYLRQLGDHGPTVIGIIPSSLLAPVMAYTEGP